MYNGRFMGIEGEVITQVGEPMKEPDKRQQIAGELMAGFEKYIIFEDDLILVINKPGGIATTRGKHAPSIASVVSAVRGDNIHPVHRLDKETSGILILGKTSPARASLSKQFGKGGIKKRYIALVDGEWNKKIAGIIAPLEKGEVDNIEKAIVRVSPGAKLAATSFQEVAQYKDRHGNTKTLLAVHIFTGRTHQIRSHLQYLGFPITGDKLYNDAVSPDISRQLLHAFEIRFRYPGTDLFMDLQAPLPGDFLGVLDKMTMIKNTPFLQKVTPRSAIH